MQQGASTQELLPCPFDGRADYLNIGSDHIDGDTRFQAWCNYCGMTGPHEATEAEAITAWNTRTPSDRNAVLEEAVERRAKQIGDSKGDPNWWRYENEAREALTTPEPTEPAGVAGLADDVERVAKALCEVAQENARRDTGDETLVASYGWQDWIPDAKAAIAALSRTPPLLEVAKEALEHIVNESVSLETAMAAARAALQAIKGAER